MKILFFDYWLKGIANFNRLIPELKQQIPDADIKMIHVGSWKESQESVVNEHEGFNSYDISYYKTWNLYKVLKKEKPNVLVMLNLSFLSDKAIITFCKKLGIKVIFLAHGKFLTNDENILNKHIKEDLKKNLASKIRIDSINILRNYLLGTFIRKEPGLFISSLIKLVKDPMSMTLKTKYSKELDVDKILVYYESDKKEFIENRNFPTNKIKVVGNPELDNFVKRPLKNREEFLNEISLQDGRYLLYLDDGFVHSKIWTKEEWYKHIEEIKLITDKANLELVMKLHPRTPLNEHKEFFLKNDIKVFKNEISFKDLIQHSEMVMSIYSTTISLALFLDKDIISPRWGLTKDFAQNYSDSLVFYPHNINELKKWLNNPDKTIKSEKTKKDTLGLTDGNSIKRIVQNIIK